MSEYQYYEFVAIDRPLSRNEMLELRSYSSRAMITATSFVNEYNWGDLKGDPADWMRRYFDAFVYTANWGSSRLALRVPDSVFAESDLMPFATNSALTVEDAGTHWIIDWSIDDSENEEYFDMENGRGQMGSLVPLRDELLRGDLRPLYLGWLAGVTAGEVKDAAFEPAVPPGLAQLSAAQQALIDFLGIDPDLVAVAAAGSPEVEEWRDDDGVEVWLTELRRNEVSIIVNLLLNGESQQAERWVKAKFFAWQKESGTIEPTATVPPRTVAQLRALAEGAADIRMAQEAQAQARQDAERRQKREAYLKTMAVDFDRCWNAGHRYAERGTASGYDEALRAISDLAEAYALMSQKEEFDRALHLFMEQHAKRGALVRRLLAAGLWRK